VSAPCEVRGVIASRQGLSCAGYYGLSAQTARLRERAYIWVRDGANVFLPAGREHFPVAEAEAYYEGRLRLGWAESIGAGGNSPVVFGCEGSSAAAADEAATIIEAALPALEELLSRPVLARMAASWPYKYAHNAALLSENPPYRPPVLPERAGVPVPVTEEERKRRPRDPTPTYADVMASVEATKRGMLGRWGLLEEYEEMKRAQAGARRREARPDPEVASSAASWKMPSFDLNRKF
jgi:hypothetical protein